MCCVHFGLTSRSFGIRYKDHIGINLNYNLAKNWIESSQKNIKFVNRGFN